MRASPKKRWVARAAVVGAVAVLSLTGVAAASDAGPRMPDAGATWASPLSHNDGATWAGLPDALVETVGATWA